MKALALLAAALLVSSASFATTLQCEEDNGKGSSATLEFKGKKFISAEIYNSGIKGYSDLRFDLKNSKVNTGSNSQDSYMSLSQELYAQGVYADISISFKTASMGKSLSLEEALVGPQYSTGGLPYGKFRFDFAVPGIFDDFGWTYSYYCQIVKD